MEANDIIILGAGGHARSCIEVVESTGKYNIVGLVTSNTEVNKPISGYRIIGHDEDLPDIYQSVASAVSGLGQIRDATLRKQVVLKAKEAGFRFPSIIASSAYVSKHVQLGEGSMVMHKTLINSGVVVGEFSIINSGAILEHGVEVGEFSHISTKVVVNGDSKVGSEVFIGSGSIVRQNLNIGRNSFISMGSLVGHDLPPYSAIKG